MATTTTPADPRLQAHALGLRCHRSGQRMQMAYRLLEEGDPTAVAVFTALNAEHKNPGHSNTWGTKAALMAGFEGDRIMVEVRV